MKVTVIQSTDVGREDSQGDIGGSLEIYVGGTEVATVLVDHDPIRLAFYSAGVRTAIPPETFVSWLRGEDPSPFMIDGVTVAYRTGKRILFPSPHRGDSRRWGLFERATPNAKNATFLTTLISQIEDADAWRQDCWLTSSLDPET